MQVSCSSCGAKYEFDASAIPAAGYDAQCTTCNAIFFVSPQQDAKPAVVPPSVGLKLSEQVAVSCNHCGAVYQFAAADIPQEGYDAQCTQCQGVFFVSVAGAAKVQPSTAVPNPEPAAAAAPTSPAAPSDAAAGAAAPASFSTPHDIPTVADDDYDSMSQVIAMERLQAQHRENLAQAAASAAPAPEPEPTASQNVSPQSFGGGETAHVAPESVAAAAAPEAAASPMPAEAAGFDAAANAAPTAAAPASDAPAPSLHDNGPAPELNPIPSWGVAAAEMAALTSEPETLAAPNAAVAASTPVPPSAAETGVGPVPSGFVAKPAAATPEASALQSFSLSASPEAFEPPPAPEPHADEPAPVTASAPLSFNDDSAAPSSENTVGDLRLPEKTGTSKMALVAGIALLAVGGAAFGVWRTGMLAGQTGEQLADAAVDNAQAAGATLADKAAKATGAQAEPAAAAAPAVVISSKARVAFERGMHSLLDDTIAGYTNAQQAFREALKIEPAMVDAFAGLALQSLLGGEDYLALGHAEWAEAKRLEGIAAAYQAKMLAPMPRGRHAKDLERERLRLAEANQQVAQWREKAILHLQIGEDTLQNGSMMLLRGSLLPDQTPLMRTSMALWLASDPYLANPGESTTTLNAARAQFTEATHWLMAPGEEGAPSALPQGADAKDPWARTWLSLAKARILAAKPTTAVQMQPFLEATITHEPHFMRARWEIARALEQAGQKEPAQKAAEALLTVMPTHEKAKALVESLKLGDAPVPAPVDKPAAKTRSRGHKLKRAR